jgi:predicted DNA-binding transcriptional regulator AlpA
MTDLTGIWLRPPAAARYLGISASTLAKWRLRGFGPKWTKLSKAVAYDRSALEEFARSNLRSSTSETLRGTATRARRSRTALEDAVRGTQ